MTYNIYVKEHVEHHPSLEAEDLSSLSFSIGIIYREDNQYITLETTRSRQTFR